MYTIFPLKNGKAPGGDEVTVEMIKAAGSAGYKWMYRVVKAAWVDKKVPEDWVRGEIVLIFKKGDRKLCKNYRGITLMSHGAKIYDKVCLNRLNVKVEPQLQEEQYGFRPGRSTVDLIFALRQIMDSKWEQKLPMIMAFLDLEKAYDHLPRKIVWECLKRKGISKGLIERIQSTYVNCLSRVQTSAGMTPWFGVKSGVRQGSVLSPLLFIVVMDDMMLKVKEHSDTGSAKTMIYADDILIWGENSYDVQRQIDEWSKVTEEFGMKISKEKSETVVLQRNDKFKMDKIRLKGEDLKTQDEFRYLGSIVTNEARIGSEIQKRVQQAEGFYQKVRKLLWNDNFPRKCKILLYKTYFLPILTYGAVTWTTGWKEESRIQASEMKFLRSIAGVSKIERKKSKNIRRELGTERLQYRIGRERLRWYGHINRMEEDRIPRMEYEMAQQEGVTRRVGRPRDRWKNQIRRDVEERGENWCKVEEEKWWEDRKLWKEFIDKVEEYDEEEEEEEDMN
jgi:hypothetical protein